MSKKNQNKMTAPAGKIVRLGENASITVLMQGESLTLRESESPTLFENALEALKNKDWDALYSAMRPVKAFANKVTGVTVTKDGVFWNGKELNNTIATRIVDFAMLNLDYVPLCKFLAKLMANPSQRAIDELYRFLEHKNLPITDNGNLLAYKGIQHNWYSLTSGTATLIQGMTKNGQIYNGVGEVIEMTRTAVDDNKDRTCSYGLHAGTEKYATQFAGTGGRTVIVEINPADVVSIPSDCEGQKLRTCKYKVVAEYTETLSKPLYASNFKEEVDDLGDVAHVSTSTVLPTRDSKGRFVSNKTTPVSKSVLSERDSKGRFISNQNVVVTTPVTPDYYSFDTPDSDWIKSIEWFDDKSLLINKLDDTCIEHTNIPYHVVTAFEAHVLSNGSAGVYYNRYIKNNY